MVEHFPFDWVSYFDAAFREVKTKFGKFYPIPDEGGVPPNILALRDAVNNLPCPVKILERHSDRKVKQNGELQCPNQ